MQEQATTGVYFSANDVVYDWALAFLNSFRAFNPALRLVLIPFNDQCDRLWRLQQTYDFEIYEDASFPRLEAIGRAFELGHTPTGPFWFRRYAAFWGPLERFMYLDARVLVLTDLKPLIDALDAHGFDLLHYDRALNQVYEPGPFRRQLLHQGRAHGFLSNIWVTRKGLFSLAQFDELATEALQIREQLNPRNTDQAFINYCCDRAMVRYAHIADVAGTICRNAWARQPGHVYRKDNSYYLWDYGGLDHKKQVVLLHWAGLRMNSLMPKKTLFARYYLLSAPWRTRVQYQIRNLADLVLRLPFETTRRNRVINTVYHRCIQR